MATKTKKKSKNAKQINTKKNDNIQKTQVAESKKADVAKDEKNSGKSTDSKEKKVSKKADKNKKPNIFVRMGTFIKGVFTELKKVNWLSKEELAKSSGVVAGIVAIFTFLVWVIDSGLGALAALLIGIK
ncbi:MAG: preprotein translocase subunit SecE [Eubacterium sp.]